MFAVRTPARTARPLPAAGLTRRQIAGFNDPYDILAGMILKVAKLGTGVLREKSKEVSSRDIARGAHEPFLESLLHTMREYDGTGIAAPQVFTGLKIFLYEVAAERRSKKEYSVPVTALFNAGYEPLGKSIEMDTEGCLSIPFLRGDEVPRYKKILVHALDRKGKSVEFEAEGFHARVLQHEIDHLGGIVYLDRMSDLRSLHYTVNFG